MSVEGIGGGIAAAVGDSTTTSHLEILFLSRPRLPPARPLLDRLGTSRRDESRGRERPPLRLDRLLAACHRLAALAAARFKEERSWEDEEEDCEEDEDDDDEEVLELLFLRSSGSLSLTALAS
mmetsp:Transcript_34165/g.72701  ORF Transcript_34165/g.72701 Transcript_34165/m.72701 type:complete len:123 (+) Transcript_34165:1051-1419(+)